MSPRANRLMTPGGTSAPPSIPTADGTGALVPRDRPWRRQAPASTLPRQSVADSATAGAGRQLPVRRCCAKGRRGSWHPEVGGPLSGEVRWLSLGGRVAAGLAATRRDGAGHRAGEILGRGATGVGLGRLTTNRHGAGWHVRGVGRRGCLVGPGQSGLTR